MIDEAVAEFDEDDVTLIAVNLQETADPIRQTLERLKIEPKVALDIDGVARVVTKPTRFPKPS